MLEKSLLELGIDSAAQVSARARVITGLAVDSRQVKPGYLFAALPGSQTDGRRFISRAIAHGAVAILQPSSDNSAASSENIRYGSDGIVWLEDRNPRQRLALIASHFYPNRLEQVAAVTGTNGKTSVVHFVHQLWSMAGIAAARLGTLGLATAGENLPHDTKHSHSQSQEHLDVEPRERKPENHKPQVCDTSPVQAARHQLTTNDPISLHQQLAGLKGITHLVLEASSHGLDQHRLDGLSLTAAGFTNLSQDHLDYHRSMSAYRAAKLRLFEQLLPSDQLAVINVDEPTGRLLERSCVRQGRPLLRYGLQGQELKLIEYHQIPHGLELSLEAWGKRYKLRLALIANFQLWNLMCALGLALSGSSHQEQDFKQLLEYCHRLSSPAGRLELVAHHPSGSAIYIDYAHTPTALEQVLSSIRSRCKGRLVLVFGCGGRRDQGKRPIMGAIAARLADRIIVTDDNPRSEDPTLIRHQIISGAARAADLEEIDDRRLAIRTALDGLSRDDVLLVAGKGHEREQITATRAHHFDDAFEIRSAVMELWSVKYPVFARDWNSSSLAHK